MIEPILVKPALGILPKNELGETINAKENIANRTARSKTFELPKNRFQFVTSAGWIHYQEDPSDPNSDFKEIDLTLIPNGAQFTMDQADFKLITQVGFVGYQFISKRGGEAIVQLESINGVPPDYSNMAIRQEGIERR